jgi:hypothetical protein
MATGFGPRSSSEDKLELGVLSRSASVLLVHAVYIACGFWCPLKAFETWLEVRGDVSAYRGPFLLHYLDAVVYPNIPPNVLIAGPVAVCLLNLWIYARRLRVRHSLG